MGGVDAHRPVRPGEANAGGRYRSSEVLEEQQGRTVGPVKVVQADQETSRLGGIGGVDEEVRNGLEEGVTLRLRAAACRGAGAKTGHNLREEGRHLRGRRDERLECLIGGGMDVLAENLDEGQIRGHALGVVRAAGEHDPPIAERPLCELTEDSRLADSGFAAEHHDAGFAAARCLQPFGESREFTFTTDDAGAPREHGNAGAAS